MANYSSSFFLDEMIMQKERGKKEVLTDEEDRIRTNKKERPSWKRKKENPLKSKEVKG